LFIEKSSIVVGSSFAESAFYSKLEIYQVLSESNFKNLPIEVTLTKEQLVGIAAVEFYQQKVILEEGKKISIKIRSKIENKKETLVEQKEEKKMKKMKAQSM